MVDRRAARALGRHPAQRVPVSGLGRRSAALGGPLEGWLVASKGLTALPRRRGSALAHGCGRGGRVVLPLARAAVISTGLRVLLRRAARQLEPLRRRGRHVVLHLHIEGDLLGVAGPSAGVPTGGRRAVAGRSMSQRHLEPLLGDARLDRLRAAKRGAPAHAARCGGDVGEM